MRIHEWNPFQAYQIQHTRTSSKQEKDVVPSRAAEDRLEISREAQIKSRSATPSERVDDRRFESSLQARIEALRQQVQAGTYEVPAPLVAQKMLQFMARKS